MTTLLICTNTPELKLKLIENNNLTKSFRIELGRQMSNKILEYITGFTDINKIDNIAIVDGPGSFTGLRIGFSVANAIAFSLSIGVTKISSVTFDNLQLFNQANLGNKFISPALPDYACDFIATPQKK